MNRDQQINQMFSAPRVVADSNQPARIEDVRAGARAFAYVLSAGSTPSTDLALQLLRLVVALVIDGITSETTLATKGDGTPLHPAPPPEPASTAQRDRLAVGRGDNSQRLASNDGPSPSVGAHVEGDGGHDTSRDARVEGPAAFSPSPGSAQNPSPGSYVEDMGAQTNDPTAARTRRPRG